MPKSAFVATALALVVAHDIRTQIKARKFRLAATEVVTHDIIHIVTLTQRNEALATQNKYLMFKLDEAGVEPDEFDLIALNFDS